ncbi:tripartite tricarboxylate transporter substrate-binding protein [Achromobacter xylosoxidans]|uniref:Tripartite tricarboxylate transporter substrate-binding protein n=1 Tax=Alcaligenes xylosoxydans xylosoxydans TaxID=85698 RepID=A0A9X3R709_ALCXX|nr:tripartite tricarboxylate transporter substrate-binding protein [Achromobacter xylosoxidans]MCZ8405362.1 tripartite tricarboxylate transporter substrate-binding protein [Achromobacter xylosoxidans]
MTGSFNGNGAAPIARIQSSGWHGKTRSSRRSVLRGAMGALLALACLPAGAQSEYPNRPIRMVVAFTAGSSSDLMVRVLAQQLTTDLKQTVIVENRPGAGGAIASAYVAQSSPDGYTVLVHSGSYVTAPWLYKSLAYDPERDLTSLAALGALPGVVIAPAGRYKDFSQLIAAGRAARADLNFASAGNGSSTHMSAEKINMIAGWKGAHIPYKGTPEAIADVSAGRSDYFVAPINTIMGMIKGARFDVLAVTSTKRTPVLPEVPTLAEAGLPGAEYPLWVGAFAPSRTPPQTVERLHAAIRQAVRSPAVQRQYQELGIEEFPMSQPEFAAFIREEIALAGELVRRANLTQD